MALFCGEFTAEAEEREESDKGAMLLRVTMVRKAIRSRGMPTYGPIFGEVRFVVLNPKKSVDIIY